MSHVNLRDLYQWCKAPAEELAAHPDLRVPFRLVKDSEEIGLVMARDFVEVVEGINIQGESTEYKFFQSPSPQPWEQGTEARHFRTLGIKRRDANRKAEAHKDAPCRSSPFAEPLSE